MAERQRAVGAIPENTPIISIPDSLCAQAGVSITWNGYQNFAAHAYTHKSVLKGNRPSPYAPCKDMVHHVRRECILFNPIVKKLVNESNGFFIFAQKLAKKGNVLQLQSEILKLSRQYRSVIRACLEDFQNHAEETVKDEEKEVFIKNIPILYNMELIWHLCEIFFIDSIPNDYILPQLITWIKFHIPQVEKQANEMLLKQSVSFEDSDEYWFCVIQCLLQRRINTVRSLLKLHPKSSTDQFKLVDTILRTMPIFSVNGSIPSKDFNVVFNAWKKEAICLITDEHFSEKYLLIIMKMMVGDESVQDIIVKHCETWYQHMIATLILTDQTVKIYDLAFYANQSITIYGGPAIVKQLDWILLSIVELDIMKMIERIREWKEPDWLATHIVNLLYLNGKLFGLAKESSNISPNKLHEELLLDYGTLMMSHDSLWQVGVDYLDCCPTEGRNRLELLLSRVRFTTEAKALKIIEVARERDLKEVVYTVSKVQGMRCLARNNISSALTWAIRCQDSAFSSQLADIYLKKYIEENKLESLDLLENLGTGMMLSDRLAFLGKYCEFRQMVKSGEEKEAAALLSQLLVTRVPPKFFWLILLNDAVPLLENSKALFTSEEVLDLMSCLNELLEERDVVLPNKQIKEIRTALSKNYAAFIIQQKQSIKSDSQMII